MDSENTLVNTDIVIISYNLISPTLLGRFSYHAAILIMVEQLVAQMRNGRLRLKLPLAQRINTRINTFSARKISLCARITSKARAWRILT